jgi:hypothetical protein
VRLDEDRVGNLDLWMAMDQFGGACDAWLRVSTVLDSTVARARRHMMAVEYLRVILVTERRCLCNSCS